MRRGEVLVAVLGAALVTQACATPRGARIPPRAAQRTSSTAATTLGPGDVFAVRVFGEPELTGDYVVQEDGTIDYPYLRLDVRGMQASQVASRISEALRLERILLQPRVSVFIREVNSRRVSVFGQVQHPGVFPIRSNMTITQAIAQAGGFTAIAEKNRVRVTRQRAGGQQVFILRVEDIAEGRADDFELLPGDVVFVPESIT